MKFISSLLFCLHLFALISVAHDYDSTKTNSSIGKKEFNDTTKELRNDLIKLNKKLDSIGAANLDLAASHDSLTKYVDDRRLRESLDSAQSTINMQNSWLNGFGTIYTIVTILIAIISIVLIVINNNLSVQTREAIRKSDDATNRLNEQTDRFESKIKKRLENELNKFTLKEKERTIDQLVDELTAPNRSLRDQACFRINSYLKSDFNDAQLNRLFTLLNQYLDLEVEEAIVYFLTKED